MAYNFEMRLNNAIKRLNFLGSADEKPKKKWDEEVTNAMAPAIDRLKERPKDKNKEAEEWLHQQSGFRANMGAADKTVAPENWKHPTLQTSAAQAMRNAKANQDYQTSEAGGELTKDAKAQAQNQAQLQLEDEKKAKALAQQYGMGGAPMVGSF